MAQRGEAAGLLHKSRHSIRRYLGRVFYVAVAAAIAHTINTTRQLAARYSKRVMAPSPSVPVPGNRACLSIFTQRSLDVYRLDFCRHSYLSSRRIWRIEVEEFHTKFAQHHCERASDEFWPPAPLILENLGWSRPDAALKQTTL